MSDYLELDDVEDDLKVEVSELSPKVLTCNQHGRGVAVVYSSKEHPVCPLCESRAVNHEADTVIKTIKASIQRWDEQLETIANL
jgi:transcription initiation factor IIE alpha subunit